MKEMSISPARESPCFDKDGKKIEHIAIHEPWTANICFGGKDMHTLFITASKSIYAIRTRVRGAGSQ